jgi:6-phosphogluconolactonase
MDFNWQSLESSSYTADCTQYVEAAINRAVRRDGKCMLGLSGGSTPKSIYQALARCDIPWHKLYVFLIDDRYVPHDHPDSNVNLVRSTLLAEQFPEWCLEHVLFPNTSLPYLDCVQTYSQQLEKFFTHIGPPNVITLGMGDDGHIASLFPPVGENSQGPDHAIATTTDRFAVRERISVTFPVLQSCPEILFFLKGVAKKKVWDDMLASSEEWSRWPAKGLGVGKTITVLYSE